MERRHWERKEKAAVKNPSSIVPYCESDLFHYTDTVSLGLLHISIWGKQRYLTGKEDCD